MGRATEWRFFFLQEFGNSVEPILEKLCDYDSFDEVKSGGACALIYAGFSPPSRIPLRPFSSKSTSSATLGPGSLPSLPYVAWTSAPLAQF